MNSQNPIDRIPEWFRPKSRRAMVLLVVVMLAIFFLQLMNQPVEKDMCNLIDDYSLKTNERNRMVFAFGAAGLNGYEIQDNQILVPKHERAKYLKALSDKKILPGDLADATRESQQFNPFMPRTQQQMIADSQKKQRIREMIMRLPFVAEAWLEMDHAREKQAFQKSTQTAVVMIQPTGGYSLDRQQVSTIKDMIAGAVAKIQAEDIVVTDMSVGVAYQNLQDSQQSQIMKMVSHKIQRRRYYQAQIERALAGIGNVEIDVDVQIDEIQKQERIAARREPEQHVATNEVIREIPKPNRKVVQPARTVNQFGGANGVATVRNDEASIVQATYVSANTFGTAKRTEFQPQDFEPPKVVRPNVAPPKRIEKASEERFAQLPSFQRNVRAGDTPNVIKTASEVVRVVVRVPQETIEQLMVTAEVPRQEKLHLLKAEIINLVKPLLPNPSFATTFPIAIEFPGEPQIAALSPADRQIVKTLETYWPLAAILLISLIALAYTRRSSQTGVQHVPPTELDPASSQDDAESLRRQLTRMIDSDPDTAAKVIKNWIRQTG